MSETKEIRTILDKIDKFSKTTEVYVSELLTNKERDAKILAEAMALLESVIPGACKRDCEKCVSDSDHNLPPCWEENDMPPAKDFMEAVAALKAKIAEANK